MSRLEALARARRGRRPEPRWRSPRQLRQVPPPMVRGWLLDRASLTRRLRALALGPVRVVVQGQGWQRALLSEAQRLGGRRHERMWVRRVRILCDGQAWVVARTVIPRTTLSGPERRLAWLGERPLGEALFASPAMRRGLLEVARLQPHQVPGELTEGAVEPVWARRSMFWLRGKPLLVTEAFLPPLLARIQEQGAGHYGAR